MRSKFCDSDSPISSPSQVWLSWPFSWGFLFPWASQHHTLTGLPAREGEDRKRLREASNKIFQHNSLYLSTYILDLSCWRVLTALQPAQSTKHVLHLPRTSHVWLASRITDELPLWSVFGWTFHSVAHLWPHKCCNSSSMWELWVFLLRLSFEPHPGTKTNTIRIHIQISSFK